VLTASAHPFRVAAFWSSLLRQPPEARGACEPRQEIPMGNRDKQKKEPKKPKQPKKPGQKVRG
jgi:hypothetical protein